MKWSGGGCKMFLFIGFLSLLAVNYFSYALENDFLFISSLLGSGLFLGSLITIYTRGVK